MPTTSALWSPRNSHWKTTTFLGKRGSRTEGIELLYELVPTATSIALLATLLPHGDTNSRKLYAPMCDCTEAAGVVRAGHCDDPCPPPPQF